MSEATPHKKAKLADGSRSARGSALHSKALFIAVYNFKGGCGKTFVTRELAATAVKAGKRVGMVDIDPQCNLTSWWLPGSDPYMGDGIDIGRRRESDDEDEGIGDERGESDAEEQVGAAGSAQALRVAQYPLHQNTELLGIQDYRSDNLPNNLHSIMQDAILKPTDFVTAELKLTEIPSPGDGELWLLPGSRQVLQLEPLLSTAQSTEGGVMSHYIGAFHAVLMRMSAQANLDVIFVDCSPSCGPLNKVAVMSCDFILPPAMVDTSNLSSLHGLLTAVLPTWYQEHRQLRKRNNIDNLEGRTSGDVSIFRLPQKPPKVLPIIAVNFALREKKNDVTRVMKAKSQWIRQMRTLFTDVILKSEQPLPADSSYFQKQHHTGLKQVVSRLQPELHGLETHYVWAVVRTLDAPLFLTAKNRWPAAWSVHSDDIEFFKKQKRDKHHEITRNDKKLFEDVLPRLLTVVNWIMSQKSVD